MEALASSNRIRTADPRRCWKHFKAAWRRVARALKPAAYKGKEMLFNDWSFKRKVKKFKPVPERRRLGPGERYEVGDEVESFEHMPTWYPATVVKYNKNGFAAKSTCI